MMFTIINNIIKKLARTFVVILISTIVVMYFIAVSFVNTVVIKIAFIIFRIHVIKYPTNNVIHFIIFLLVKLVFITHTFIIYFINLDQTIYLVYRYYLMK
jgi:hypothetical protein